MKSIKIEDYGFVVLCPERNYGGLKATVRSIKNHFCDKSCICVTTPEANELELKEFNQICPTFIGGKTYTSLINTGIRQNQAKWTYFVMAGIHIRNNQMNHYNTFCANEKTIMYPIIDKMWMFHESSLNGLVINKKAIEDVGYFDEVEEDFHKVRLVWAVNAIEKGYQFRALVGLPR